MRGQAGFEYMLILAISMVILIPLFIYVNQYSSSGKEELGLSAMRDSLQNLAEAADLVWSQGSPARQTITLYMPSGVRFTNVSGNTLHVRLIIGGKENDVIVMTNAPVSGSLPIGPGRYSVRVDALPEGYVNVSY